ncbi:uncharacterized protein LACBIDRAFT_317738 [Laccaria bicolor S238N-H82]|uniref:Predicted protein n=1 Tax=Laccaria bicolor (strain S238N-H82 / ATCC MYA-4686) TaxID=486041 RepID=B0E2A0_LACBS|nr:uncharacterized protein LACBIDRAFT_317738 [Laccaria bicolor S238N-H82]EDQ99033.1 predicted protein [Laccaria bicolor S238N-H82]|eukprot:XP_001890308.1 predicted protein [Laccaria bicolor S238N-H82]
MTDTTDREVQPATSSSAMADIENALESLRLTRSDAQQLVRAFVTILHRTIPVTPTSSPSTSPPSFLSATSDHTTGANLTSYEMLGFGGYSTGDEDLQDFDDEDKGDDPSPSPLQCPTCALPTAATQPSVANAGSAPSAAIACTTAVAETPAPVVVVAPSAAASVSVQAASPIVIATAPSIAVPTSPAAAPVLTPAASIAAVTAPLAANSAATTTTASVAVAVVAPAASAAPVGPAAPPYTQLPLNAPSNAILPPPHLVTVHGYHVPGPNDYPPFYVVTRGRNIGVFSGWENVSPLVTGVSHAVYSRVSSIAEGHARMAMARASSFALYLV